MPWEKTAAMICAALLLAASPAWAAEADSRVKVGGVTATLAGPEGLTQVYGRDVRVDNYIRQAAKKLKLEVLAVYAEPGEWRRFVAAAGSRRPAALPGFALLCTTLSMPGKSYDQKALRREFGKYDHWFGLAAGNRPLAALLTARGNRKLADVLGANIGFKFKVDQFTRRFDQGSAFISLGAKVGFNIFGQPAEAFLTATALAVGDKIVFLGYLEPDGPPETVRAIENRAKAWRRALGGLNAG